MAPPVALRWLPAAAEVAGGAATAFHFGPPLCRAPAAAQARTLQQTTSTRYYGKSLYECVVNAGLTTTKQMIDVRAQSSRCCLPPAALHAAHTSAGRPPRANRLPPDLFRIACAAVGREPCRVCGRLAFHVQRCLRIRYQVLGLRTEPSRSSCRGFHLTVQAAGPEVISLFTNPTLAITFLAPDNQNWLT